MNSFESMKKKLEQTEIYNVAESSNVFKELKAYAEGIDTLYSMLLQLERECYILTAENYGLDMREKFTGENRQELSVEQRRELLCCSEQHKTDCTLTEFKSILSGYGLKSFSITENPTNYSIIINISDELTQEQQSVVESKINADFPLHLNIEIIYGS